MLRRLFFPLHTLKGDGILLVLQERTTRDKGLGIKESYTYEILHAVSGAYLGYVSLRVGESPEIYYLGHIGYRVEAPYRGHGYAKKAVLALLPLLRRLGYVTLSITTDTDNLPSRKTCINLGCELESIVKVPERFRPLCMNSPAKCRYILFVDQMDMERTYQ